MKKKILILLISTLITLCVIFVGLQQVPYFYMNKSNKVSIDGAGGVNRFYFQDLADESFDIFPSPCPDLLYSNLVFDLSKTALFIEFPIYNDFWVSQMVADNTDTFAYVGYKTLTNSPVKIVLFSSSSPKFNHPPGAKMIKAPSDKGLILLRHLVKDKNDLSSIDAIRKSVRIIELSKGNL
ncbi:MAG: DUF1254 domain-containing protein [Deltaproteobacteria bacterium]|nr:DUF1254 domain-containing protein [Deltaproteobacteria bacterium]